MEGNSPIAMDVKSFEKNAKYFYLVELPNRAEFSFFVEMR